MTWDRLAAGQLREPYLVRTALTLLVRPAGPGRWLALDLATGLTWHASECGLLAWRRVA